VGAVVVDDQLRLVGEGWHERYGGPHAEVQALAHSGPAACGATLFVTLEPCCHVGKTPPCVDAVIAAGIRRVVVGMQDPFAQVAGQGIARLREAKIDVEVGFLEPEARRLAAPFCKLVETGLLYVHAKWAMTLDGRIAARTGQSKWISNEASRAVAHRLRGRMDAIAIGIGTALADDPLLTARPAGPRVATRIVFDSQARLPLESQLVRTADTVPLLVVVGPRASADNVSRLRGEGAEVLECPTREQPDAADRIDPPRGPRRTGPAADDQRARRRRQPPSGRIFSTRSSSMKSTFHRPQAAWRRRRPIPRSPAQADLRRPSCLTSKVPRSKFLTAMSTCMAQCADVRSTGFSRSM